MTTKGIFVFDIDGTLTHRLDWIDPEVVARLEQLIAADWQVAFFTGRIFSFATSIIDAFSFPYLLGVQNGADLLQMPGNIPLYRRYLKGQVLPHVESAYEGEKEDYIIYAGIDEGDFCYFRPEKFSKKGLEYLEVLQSLSAAPWKKGAFPLPEEFSFPLIKAFGGKKEMERVKGKLKSLEEIEISLIRDPVDPSLYLNLITHPEANKGSALEWIKEHFSIPYVIAAGDSENDRNMLAKADLSIAIETAPPDVREEADILARPPEELGIIDAIEEALSLARR